MGGLRLSLARVVSQGSVLVFYTLWGLANVALPIHYFLWKLNTLKEKADVPFNVGPNPDTLNSKVLFKCSCVMLKVACLLSYAMLGLTMCRWTWTRLSPTWIRKFIPFDHFESLHRFSGVLGWFELLTVTLVYLVNWTKLCQYFRKGQEDWNFCKDFYSEIMITGYLLIFFHSLVIATSIRAVRRRRFEWFYWFHHLFIAIFLLTIFHPMDWRHRRGGKERFQAWPVMIGPVTLYLFDRLMQILTHRFTLPYKIILLKEPKTIFLKLHAPPGYLNQKPGMICWLNNPAVSWLNWHPYSIAHTDHLGSVYLIIHVLENGWTHKLWNALIMATPQVPFKQERIEQNSKLNTNAKFVKAATLKFQETDLRFERAMQHGLARENDSFATLSNDDAVPLSKVVSDEDDYPSRLAAPVIRWHDEVPSTNISEADVSPELMSEKVISAEELCHGLCIVRQLWRDFCKSDRHFQKKLDLIDSLRVSEFERYIWLENWNVLVPRLAKWSGNFGLSGPFTAGVTEASHFDHSIMIGGGSGIVTCLSHLKDFVTSTSKVQKKGFESKMMSSKKSVLRSKMELITPRTKDRMKKKDLKYLIEVSVSWAVACYAAIILEFLTGMSTFLLMTSGCFQKNTFGPNTWFFCVIMTWIVFGIFSAHKIIIVLTYGFLPRNTNWCIAQQAIDWLTIAFTLACLLTNHLATVPIVDEAMTTIARGSIVNSIRWAYLCFISQEGGYFCHWRLLHVEGQLMARFVWWGLSASSLVRWARIWAQTPRLLSGAKGVQAASWEKELGVRSVQTMDLIWVLKNTTWLLTMGEEINSLLSQSNAQFSLKIFLTGSDVTEQEIDELFENQPIRACIQLGRPNLHEEVVQTCKGYLNGIAKGEKTGVFASGPAALQASAKEACQVAAEIVMRETENCGGEVSWHAEKFA